MSAQATQVYLSRTADKAQRKLDRPLRVLIRDSLVRIAQSPQTQGEQLCSPLGGVYSHHVKYQGREFRIAYQFNPESDCVVILLIGPHENFYKRLKVLVDSFYYPGD